METESVELEEGEVVDDDDDDEPVDTFGSYNVLQRPLPQAPAVQEPSSELKYSDESDVSAPSESDSDSDEGPCRTKKPKIKIKRSKLIYQQQQQLNNKCNDKYKVWCTQIQEESLTEDLVSCGVTKKSFYTDRSVESYDFTLGYNDKETRRPSKDSSDEEQVQQRPPRLNNKRTFQDRKNVKLRLGKRRPDFEEDHNRGAPRIIEPLTLLLEDSSNEELAAEMASRLYEKKDSLIRKVVDVLGREQAIEFFEKTRRIEEEGGMLVMNGSRRRTPGGIYLYLVKNDEHIPQPKIKEIFYQDRKEMVTRKKQMGATNRKQKAQEMMKFLENGSDKDLSGLTSQIAEEARLRRGEGMDRNVTDAERTVSNPPPSPATDDPDHTENNPVSSNSGRQIQDYEDDFLDVGLDADSMEVF